MFTRSGPLTAIGLAVGRNQAEFCPHILLKTCSSSHSLVAQKIQEKAKLPILKRNLRERPRRGFDL